MKDYNWRIIGSLLFLGVTIVIYIEVISNRLYLLAVTALLGWWIGLGLDRGRKKIKITEGEINRLSNVLNINKSQLNQFQLVLNSLQEGVLYLDSNWEFLYVNETWEHITGFTSQDTVGKSVYSFICTESHSEFEEKFKNVTENEGYHYFTLKIKKMDSEEYVWMNFVVRSLEQGGFIATVTDKTEQMAVKRNYEKANTRLEQILKNYSSGVLFINEKNILTLVNNRLMEYLNNISPMLIDNSSIGIDIKEALTKWSPYLVEAPEEQSEKILNLIQENKPAYNQIIKLINGYVLSCDFIPLQLDNEDLGCLLTFKDITEEYFMNHALLEAKEEAELASKAKSDFLSNMSHEIRTPLNAIVGFSQLLKLRQHGLSADEQDYLDEIVNASHHLLNLVNDILNLSQIESGKSKVTLEEFAINDVLEESIRLVSPILKKENLNLHIDLVTNKNVYVQLDKVRLKQIFINLLSNAIKYNKTNGSVYISSTLDKEQKSVLIHIIDTGIGMNKKELERVFEEFYRGSEHEQLIEGIGVGLTITKGLVELMGGHIKVTSEKGKGTTFTLSFPIIQEYLTSGKTEEEPSYFYNSVVPYKLDSNIRIIYVENNPINIEVLRVLLSETQDVVIDYARNTWEAINKLQNNYYDLILVDIHLPDRNGYDLLRFIRQGTNLNQETPVVAVSGDATEQQIVKAIETGFADYITKPIKLNRLVESIHDVLLNEQKRTAPKT